jgi:DNA gyrase subunit B
MEETIKKYDEDDIQVLEGLEAVRKRPGMYIGTTSSRGLHHLVWEIVDNAIDEALAGYCNQIEVIINEDNSITVKDNGRGIPTGIHSKTGISTVETVFTILHAGGKFGGNGYKVSGGLHGVGASVVNALSKLLEVKVYQNGQIHYVRFEDGGRVAQKLGIIDTCSEELTGTVVKFKPDPEIFQETIVFEYELLRTRIRELSYLNKGLKIILIDDRDEKKKEEFLSEGGISEYVELLNKNKSPIHRVIDINGECSITKDIHLMYILSQTTLIPTKVEHMKKE